MTSQKTRKDPRPGGAPVDAKQARSIVKNTRSRSDDLIAAGVNRERLEARLAKIENHLDQEHHDPVMLQSLLTELQADLIQVENKLIDTGVLELLHQILGTGVPPPR